MFGFKALVAKQNLSLLTLEIRKVKPDGYFQNMIFETTVQECLPWDDEAMERKEMKSQSNLDRGEKRFMVKQIWGNNVGNTDGARDGCMLDDADLTAIHELLQWQYKQPLIALAGADLVKLACIEGHSSEVGAQCLYEIKELMKVKKVIVLPIHADEPLHWTALALVMTDVGSSKVEEAFYFDWLKNPAPRNQSYARKILRLLTINPDDSSYTLMPAKHNTYVQRAGSNDCGFVVWYALEVFMKQLRMEGKWMICPDPASWRRQLCTLVKGLIQEQQKWMIQDAMEKKPAKKDIVKITLPGNKETLDPYEAKAMNEMWLKEGKLKIKAAEFFTCAKCRWGGDGVGCVACNPDANETLLKKKEKEVKHLQNSVDEWYEMMKKKGIVPEYVPQDRKAEPGKKICGGGEGSTGTGRIMENSTSYITNVIYIIYIYI